MNTGDNIVRFGVTYILLIMDIVGPRSDVSNVDINY